MTTKAPKARSVVSELEEELAADMEKVKAPGKPAAPAKKAPAPAAPVEEAAEEVAADEPDTLVAHRVKFFDLQSKPHEGVVLTHDKKKGVLEVDPDPADGNIWEVKVKDAQDLGLAEDAPVPSEPVEEAEGESAAAEPEPEPEAAKKGKAKKAPAAAQTEPVAPAPKGKTPAQDLQDGVDARHMPFLLKISEIEIPEEKVREVDKSSDRYKNLVADLKKNEQEIAIVVSDRAKPVLVEGGHRVAGLEELGHKTVWAVVRAVTSVGDRIHTGLRYNLHRKEMTWLEVARAFRLVLNDDKSISQAQLAREFSYSKSDVTRMLATISPNGLGEELLQIAEKGSVVPGKAEPVTYPQTIFHELVSVPEGTEEGVREQVLGLMRKGMPVTTTDVREIAKEVKAQLKGEVPPPEPGDEADEGPKKGGDTSSGSKGSTYRDLTPAEIGELGVRVFPDKIRLTLDLPWENKTFRGFELFKQIKAAINQAWSNKELTVRDEEALAKAMTAVRAEILGNLES